MRLIDRFGLWLGLGVLVALAMTASFGGISPWPALWIGTMSAGSSLMYAADKWAASRSWRRTPERWLLIVAVLGGWPGALISQPLMNHKLRKTRFVVSLWSCVAVNVALLATFPFGHA